MMRIQKYITMQHEVMVKTFGNNLLTVKWVAAVKKGEKIPYNREEETRLFEIATGLIKANGVKKYPDLRNINTMVRNLLLHSTTPTIWILYLSIIEANTNYNRGIDQVRQTLYYTDNLYGKVRDALKEIRPLSYTDLERFISPWAENVSDEEKFDQTIAKVGNIMSNDSKLHALYHMLVMITPSKKTPAYIRVSTVHSIFRH